MGDFLSLESMSGHDKDKPLLREGRRLHADILHGMDALARIETPITEYNKGRAASRHRKYGPARFWLNANHEDRSMRYLTEHPELVGMWDPEDLLGVRRYGWETIPYKDYVYLEGVAFTHIPMNRRNSFTPIGGEFVAKRAADLHAQSIVFGHTHRFIVHDYARNVNGKCERFTSLNCGWFGDTVPAYAEATKEYSDWWAGLILLHHLNDGGVFDIETIGMDRLKRDYL